MLFELSFVVQVKVAVDVPTLETDIALRVGAVVSGVADVVNVP